jgi:hypothetical protein
MANRLLRTQILLEPEQHQELTEIARRQKRSMSDVIRGMLNTQLEQLKEDEEATLRRQLEALKVIQQHRQEILDRRGGVPIDIDTVELLNQMREERDAELMAAAYDNRD